MKVSVIIPNYNGRETIERCIESIKSQDYEPFEIILIDDRSTDGSVEIVKEKFPDTKIFKNKNNRGAAYSRNKGIELSGGDWMFFIDNDCYLKDGGISRLIDECEDFDIVYPVIDFVNGNRMHPRNENEEKFLRMSTAFMLKRKSLSKLDGNLFDEDYYFLYEDEDFFTNCELCKLKAKYCPEAKVIHTQQPKGFNVERGKLEDQSQKYYYFKIRNKILFHIKFRKFRDSIDFEKFQTKIIFNDLRQAVVSRDVKRGIIYLRAVLWVIFHWNNIRKKKLVLNATISPR